MRALIATLLVLPTLSAAQDVDGSTTARKVKYAERTEIEFTQREIQAGIVRPSGTILAERVEGVFPPMIDLRTNFDAEMRESVLHVR